MREIVLFIITYTYFVGREDLFTTVFFQGGFPERARDDISLIQVFWWL